MQPMSEEGWAHVLDLSPESSVTHLTHDHAQDFSTLHRMDEVELRAYHVGLTYVLEVGEARGVEPFDAAEQARRWAALDNAEPCGHTMSGTCDYC